jgi:hypothetical protein
LRAGYRSFLPRSGRSSSRYVAIGFFESLTPLEITRFEPHTIFDGGDKVFVLIAFEATAQGKRYSFPNNGHLWQTMRLGKSSSTTTLQTAGVPDGFSQPGREALMRGSNDRVCRITGQTPFELMIGATDQSAGRRMVKTIFGQIALKQKPRFLDQVSGSRPVIV